jgi:ABC-2 type transporter
MRWYIIRTLLYKEWLRHLADRGGIFLAILMVVATLLLSVFRKTDSKSVGFSAGIKGCHLVWYRGPRDHYQDYFRWIYHLENHRPQDIKFRSTPTDMLARDDAGDFVYEQSMAAIEIEPFAGPHGKPSRYQVRFRYPGKDPSVVGALARWFWEETFAYFHEIPLQIETAEDQTIFPPGPSVIHISPSGTDDDGRPLHKLLFARDLTNRALTANGNGLSQGGRSGFPNLIEIEDKRVAIPHSADERSMVATALVMFSMCFFCVYLLPALTCEERERGILLAQALSPASPMEILAAKFLFYPAIGIGLAALLAGIYNPVVLVRPLFWLVLVITTIGYLGVGMTIASLAHTQRMASMGALAYMLTVGLFLYITEQFGIPSFRFIALEFYCPRMLHEVMMGSVRPVFWYLLPAFLLACLWSYLASLVFRKRGWQ